MLNYKLKPKIIEAFEFGSGEFPIWFNLKIGNYIELIDDIIFSKKEQEGCIAGHFLKNFEDIDKNDTDMFDCNFFRYGDMIINDSGKVYPCSKEFLYSKYEMEQNCLSELE